jgi:hypothetical protein
MYLQCLAKVPNQRMQRNGSNRYGYAYPPSPSADTQAVRPRQRSLVCVQFISGFIAEFKWCGFWAAVVKFGCWEWWGDRNKKYQKNDGTGGTIFLV